MKFIIATFFYLIVCFTAVSQSTTNFRSPMDIPLQLSGNFGELRPGHFHAGLDIRTQGKVGLPIYAIDSGYVSRIAVSEGGYGKVIYITHPNGFTSVYAHLRKFYGSFQGLARDIQYGQQVFQFDSSLTETNLTVAKGDIIGYSGNTGGSAGPHLHFEIRNTKTKHPINPLLFGFEIKDNIAPKIYAIGIYPLSTTSNVNGKNEKRILKTVGNGKQFELEAGQYISVNGKIGFGIYTRDKFTGSPFNFGIYSIELFKENQLVYKHQLDSLDFDHSRCINAHMDFHEATKKSRKIQRSYLLPGNKLNTYSDVINNGELFFLKDDTVAMKYIIRDYNGNSSVINFKVMSNSNSLSYSQTEPLTMLRYGKENQYKDSTVSINFPATCLYQNTPLNISYAPAIGRCATPIAHINSLFDPLNDYMDLGFNLSHLPLEDQKKAVVVSLNEKMQVLAAEGGKVESNQITCKTRSFGPYTVFIDQNPPKISAKNFIPGATYQSSKRLYFRCSDDISGLGRYEAFIDGKWTLVEYEKNRKQLFFELDKVEKSNSIHTLKIVLSDKVGNTREYESSFIY